MKCCKAIASMFQNSNDPDYYRKEYCALTCSKDCDNRLILRPGIHETLDGKKIFVDTTIIAT